MSLRIGDLIQGEVSSYRVLRMIGIGGMSTVWLAEDIRTTKKLVIKVPNGQGVPFHKLIFERDLLKRLSHTHLCNYVDAGIYGFLPFLVMEFANGPTMEQSVTGKILDEDEAKIRAVEILLAVDYLHSRNIMHRDIKPKNIIIGDSSYLKVLDLGTATYFNTAGIGEAIISPGGYTAPEQYRFTSSIQGDIWSVAATTFFNVTGQNPQTFLQGYPNTKPVTPPDPRRINKNISEDFAQVIIKGMSFDPTERYSTAKEMIGAIESRVPLPSTKGPSIEVFGQEIKIDTSRLVFGIMVEGPLATGERVRVTKKGGTTEVQVYDPNKWISRKHFELFERGRRWYFKDLGSLNRSAIFEKGNMKEVWLGHGRESPAQELSERAMIYLAYGSSLKNPPYLVVTFKA